jgi:hypothetical protein
MRVTAYFSQRALMRAIFAAVLLLLPLSCAVLAAPAVREDTIVGSPPALAPGQAPPLPQAGPLAEPRSSNQEFRRAEDAAASSAEQPYG